VCIRVPYGNTEGPVGTYGACSTRTCGCVWMCVTCVCAMVMLMDAVVLHLLTLCVAAVYCNTKHG
jgi:hypothetical protein